MLGRTKGAIVAEQCKAYNEATHHRMALLRLVVRYGAQRDGCLGALAKRWLDEPLHGTRMSTASSCRCGRVSRVILLEVSGHCTQVKQHLLLINRMPGLSEAEASDVYVRVEILCSVIYQDLVSRHEIRWSAVLSATILPGQKTLPGDYGEV